MPLTDVVVRAATPQSRTRKLFDGRGLYLEISPSGGRWWRWKYRVGGKEKRLSLGVYPDVSLKAARARREAVRQQLAAGIDPGQARKAQKLALTGADSFEAIAREWHAKFSAGSRSSIWPATGPTAACRTTGWCCRSSVEASGSPARAPMWPRRVPRARRRCHSLRWGNQTDAGFVICQHLRTPLLPQCANTGVEPI